MASFEAYNNVIRSWLFILLTKSFTEAEFPTLLNIVIRIPPNALADSHGTIGVMREKEQCSSPRYHISEPLFRASGP